MLKHSLLFSLSLLLLTTSLFSDDTEHTDPLFTGTLLAVYPKNTPPCRLTVQPYLYATRFNGFFDKNWNLQNNINIHQYTFAVLFETGITKFLDIGTIPNFIRSSTKHFDTVESGDTPFFIGLQFAEDKKDSWVPDIRLQLQETFPTGEYQNLDARLGGIDSSGTGGYQTSFIFITRKIFGRESCHPYNINVNLFYTFSSDVEVSGFNTFGGDATTSGKVRPGDAFITNLAFEMEITKKFGYGFDLNYQHRNASIFFPKRNGRISTGLSSSEIISLAPCLEYNFSEDMGLIWGVWFPLAGRNITSFFTAALSFFYEF